MKHIVKQQEPQALADFKALANENWDPSFNNLDGDTKEAVKDALMAEQGHLCCYCERRVTPDDSHIEHFIPQSDESIDPLDFSNMLCSCQNALHKEEVRHCGHLKGNATLPVSPLDASCETRFSFTGDGHINPARSSDSGAIEAIQILGLDISKLRAQRAGAIEPFLDSILTEDDFRLLVADHLQQDEQGTYMEFYTTIQYLFGGYATA